MIRHLKLKIREYGRVEIIVSFWSVQASTAHRVLNSSAWFLTKHAIEVLRLRRVSGTRLNTYINLSFILFSYRWEKWDRVSAASAWQQEICKTAHVPLIKSKMCLNKSSASGTLWSSTDCKVGMGSSICARGAIWTGAADWRSGARPRLVQIGRSLAAASSRVPAVDGGGTYQTSASVPAVLPRKTRHSLSKVSKLQVDSCRFSS